MNLLRAIRIARCRRDFQPPEGATHVLEYLPSWLMCPEPGEGAWSLQSLDNWLAGTPDDDYPLIDGPSSMTGEDFGQYPVLDEAAYLGRFAVEISDGERTMTDAPCWWIEVTS